MPLMVSPFPKTDSITREQYDALRGDGDHAVAVEVVVTNPCVVCAAQIPEGRLTRKALTCSDACGQEHRRRQQRLFDSRRPPRPPRPGGALEVRSAAPSGNVPANPPDRLVNLVCQLTAAGQRVTVEVDGLTVVVG